MKLTSKILKETSTEDINKYDNHYKNLKCKLNLVNQKDKDYDIIKEYITSNSKFGENIVDIFKIEREGEK